MKGIFHILGMALLAVAGNAGAAQQTINVGSSANDGTGDSLRTAFGKTNANFSEVYGKFAAFSPIGNLLTTASTPAAARYLRLNSDGTVTQLSAGELAADIGATTVSNVLFLSTTQTVTGDKTFSGLAAFSGTVTLFGSSVTGVATNSDATAGTSPSLLMTPAATFAALDSRIGTATQAAITTNAGTTATANRFAPGDCLTGLEVPIFRGFYPQTGTPTSTGNVGTTFYNHPVAVRSILNTVFFRSGGSGNIEVQVRKMNGKNIHVVSRSSAIAISSGDNNLTSANFGTIYLNPGEFVAVKATAAYCAYASQPAELQVYIKLGDTADDTVVGDYVVAGQSVGFAWSATPLAPRNAGVVAGARTQIWKETFGNSLPVAWTFTGTWTASGGLVTPVGAGDMTQTATLGVYMFGERLSHEWVLQPQSTSSIIALGTQNNSLALMDWNAPAISLRNGGANTASIPSAFATTTAATGVSGRNYRFVYNRNQRVNTATVTDQQTLGSFAATEDKDNAAGTNYVMSTGAMDGFPYIVNRAQTTKILSFAAYWNGPRPLVVIIGDSITAGFSMKLADRWSQRLSDRLGGGVLIFGIGGESSNITSLAVLSSMLDAIRPLVVIDATGTNDTDSNLSQRSFNAYALEKLLGQKGIIYAPVILPSTPSKTFTNINSFLLGRAAANSNVRPIRWDYALTSGNDGTTYVSGNYMDAGIHPAVAAQPLLVPPVFAAVPELEQ